MKQETKDYLKCMFGFHKWAKWKEVVYNKYNVVGGVRMRKADGFLETYVEPMQERKCERCGKIQLSRLG